MKRCRTTRIVNLAGFLFLAAALCTMGGCAASGGNGAPQATLAAMSLCNRTEAGCSQGAAFSLASIRDLAVDAQWSHLPEGTHTETVELLEPGGGSYQVQNVSFAIDGTAEGAAQATVVFPVAGSWITERAITGNWNVRISLDGQNILIEPVEFQP